MIILLFPNLICDIDIGLMGDIVRNGVVFICRFLVKDSNACGAGINKCLGNAWENVESNLFTLFQQLKFYGT